ncbi:HIT family protein [Gilvimarinus algae]|uniref:HIT family protein n=1 Tax=Gilvimarinus algae TaxID=3058037 RepID=A0ABT8TFA4_9GAMM|nr:HIT family protein [Gilvimarinus sp. SDUM040014]MDO3382728.1 HIT family protein [Gilvimarinus sp. SDUM040014]
MVDFYCNEVLSGAKQVDVVWESDKVLAFHHTQPYYEAHVVIIPKRHINSVTCVDEVDGQLASDFMSAIAFVSAMIESQFGGCRVCSNVGSYQTTKLLHWYVHAGKRLRE